MATKFYISKKPVLEADSKWYNELGSVMTITSVDTQTGVFTGTYESQVGQAGKTYLMSGRYDNTGDTLGWTVNWLNFYLNAHSVTTWSGHSQIQSNGQPIILTTWLLTSQTTPEDNCESTQVGFDQFTQTQPTPESIEQAKIRCRRSHHKLA